MRIVIALGGNALIERGDKPDAVPQLAHIQRAAHAIAPLAHTHELLICHGNGPQIGLLALESTLDTSLTNPYPLDVLGAQTQGMIGYWLQQSLRNEGVRKPVVTLVTQVRVSSADAGFRAPTKFVGPGYTQSHAESLAARHGWSVALDGRHWRRVVASPVPEGAVEQESINRLLGGSVVICAGGGGAPVTEDDAGRLHGVDAVVDKDLTAALLAIAVAADRLLVLTDVRAVMRNFGTPQEEPIARLELGDPDEPTYAAGSMGPKIEACRQFVAATGRSAAIGALDDVAAVLAGEGGTTITAHADRTEYTMNATSRTELSGDPLVAR